ncbi:MAG: saccharopine dehydrogenase family protein [Chromatiales bacterium]|nr:saccharopine dehydrogenase family protein [Chromatiales bacterium]
MSDKDVLVIGAGGVASVTLHKMAMNRDLFPGRIAVASRTLSKCEAIASSVRERTGQIVETFQVDADDVEQTVALIEKLRPALLVNLALPYQDLSLMEACLRTGVHYLDTANYEPPDEAKFEYSHQWKLHDRFREAGLMAALGVGFDPGVTSIFAAHVRKHHLSGIRLIDILDCNGGDHGHPFATNFNPEINIREVTAEVRHWEKGGWVTSPAMSTKVEFDFDQVGPRNMYLMYHEELESLVTHFPEIERARFWMTFGDAYINHVTVLQNVGMTSIEPIEYQGQQIVPLQFLKAVLPNPGDLGARTRGKTNIGDIITGPARDGSGEKTFYIYNVCDHEACFQEVGSQAVSYTTGVPAFIGAALMLDGTWSAAGVFNTEQLDPDPFMEMLNHHGLPWQIVELPAPASF